MPDNADKVYLCEREEIEFHPPMTCLPGRVAVIMHSGEKRGILYNPASGKLRPDMGIVVDPSNTGLHWGDEVIVKPYDGKWLENYHDGKDLRLYGVNEPWSDSIIAKRTPLGLEPLEDWVLIEREEAETFLILPDKTKLSANFGTLRAVGPKMLDVFTGDRIVYAVLSQDDALKVVFGGHDALVFVKGEALLAQVVQ